MERDGEESKECGMESWTRGNEGVGEREKGAQKTTLRDSRLGGTASPDVALGALWVRGPLGVLVLSILFAVGRGSSLPPRS